MNIIFMMGFDVWGDHQSRETYLEVCRSSQKYAKGIWYVLENAEGKPVSSLITYIFDPVGGKSAVGVGSIATEPSSRRQGRAGQLLSDLMTLLHDRDGSEVFYLYADIDPKYYERYDFVKLPDILQLKSGSVAMIRCSKELRKTLLSNPDFRPPGYF